MKSTLEEKTKKLQEYIEKLNRIVRGDMSGSVAYSIKLHLQDIHKGTKRDTRIREDIEEVLDRIRELIVHIRQQSGLKMRFNFSGLIKRCDAVIERKREEKRVVACEAKNIKK